MTRISLKRLANSGRVTPKSQRRNAAQNLSRARAGLTTRVPAPGARVVTPPVRTRVSVGGIPSRDTPLYPPQLLLLARRLDRWQTLQQVSGDVLHRSEARLASIGDSGVRRHRAATARLDRDCRAIVGENGFEPTGLEVAGQAREIQGSRHFSLHQIGRHLDGQPAPGWGRRGRYADDARGALGAPLLRVIG